MSTNALRTTLRPAAGRTDYREPSLYRIAGVAIALVGLMVAAVALIANLVVAGGDRDRNHIAKRLAVHAVAARAVLGDTPGRQGLLGQLAVRRGAAGVAVEDGDRVAEDRGDVDVLAVGGYGDRSRLVERLAVDAIP